MKTKALLFSSLIALALALPAYAAAQKTQTAASTKPDQAIVMTVVAPTPAPTITAVKTADAAKPVAPKAKAKKAKKESKKEVKAKKVKSSGFKLKKVTVET